MDPGGGRLGVSRGFLDPRSGGMAFRVSGHYSAENTGVGGASVGLGHPTRTCAGAESAFAAMFKRADYK